MILVFFKALINDDSASITTIIPSPHRLEVISITIHVELITLLAIIDDILPFAATILLLLLLQLYLSLS